MTTTKILELPPLPSGIRLLTDPEKQHLIARHPTMPKSPAECVTCRGRGEFLWYTDVSDDVDTYRCSCEDQWVLNRYLTHCGIGLAYQRMGWRDAEWVAVEHQESVAAYLERSERFVPAGWGMVFSGLHGNGKCLDTHTPVLMADGSLVGACEIRVGDKLATGFCLASESNGVQSLLEIETTWGQRIRVTEEHPFKLVSGEWKLAEDLCEGDELVGLVDWEPDNPSETLSEEALRLLGYLVGDGSCSQLQPCLAIGNSSVLADAQWCADILGFGLVKAGDGDYRLNRARSFIREHGLLGCTSYTKRVPKEVFRQSNKNIAHFLAAYFDADGHASKSNVEFYSVHRELLVDVQHLLMRLGIISKLSLKNGLYQGKRHVSWRLGIMSPSWHLLRDWPFHSGKVIPDRKEPLPNEEGLCWCGCGEFTLMAPKTNARLGWVKGKPQRYLDGHATIARQKDRTWELRVKSVNRMPILRPTWALQVDSGEHWTAGLLTHNTMLSILMLKDLLGRDHDGFFVTMARMIEMYTSGWKEPTEKIWFDHRVRNATVLVLDDAGREYQGQNRHGLPESTFDDVLRHRVSSSLPTIITTNRDKEDLATGYGKGVMSLLAERSEIIEFRGEDARPLVNVRLRQEIERGITRPVVVV